MAEDHFRDLVNASGFPFQIRVAHEIDTTSEQHGWSVVAREHHWENSETRKEGFIDLILRKEWNIFTYWFLVLECKRIRGGNWIFMTDHEHQTSQDAHTLEVGEMGEDETGPIWNRVPIAPACPLSSFCTVQGQDERATPMLERVCTELLESLECFADEVKKRIQKPIPEGMRYSLNFVPVIVINAELITAVFEPRDIDLEKGELGQGQGEFTAVPYVRFQKGLKSRYGTDQYPTDIPALNKDNERTVFIVRAPYLPDFLKRFDFV